MRFLRDFLSCPRQMLLIVLLVVLGGCGEPVGIAGEPGPRANENSEIEHSRMATFAVRALGDAGLVDPAGPFADYRRITGPENGVWTVEFESSECTVTPESEKCEVTGTLTLEIEQRGEDLAVRDVHGQVTPEQERRLENYREAARPEGAQFAFAEIQLVDGVDESLELKTTATWTGPIPAPQTHFECRAELLNSSGEVVYRGPDVELRPPSEEEQRSGAIYTFGTPGIEPSAVQEASEGQIICVERRP